MMAQIQPDSPAFSEYSTLQKQIASIEKYQLKGNYSTMKTYLAFAQKTIDKIKQKDPSANISAEEQKLAQFQSSYDNANQPRNTDEHDYFRNLDRLLRSIYSDLDMGADAADGLKFVSSHINLEATQDNFKDFSKDDLYARIEAAKQKDDFQNSNSRYYVEKIEKAFNDYPRFINNSASCYKEYLRWLQNIGVKGDPIQEKIHLNATKSFCELLLKFAPGNPTASKWLNEVEAQLGNVSGSISYASKMHEKHMGEMLFSTKEVAIGNETEADFTTEFKSGDYIYATVYLPAKLRTLTDSYAANNVEFKIDGSMLCEGSMSPIWVTTPMQEKNYLQFAIVPSPEWTKRNSQVYVDNKIRTHEHIANGLIRAGAYSGTKVDVKFIFRGTFTNIKGSFNIDLSSGTDFLKSVVANEENSRLSNQKLPAAGMVNADLQQQALNILKKSSADSGKTYHKAIILSKEWDYDKSYAGVTVSRSIVIAMVSKEYDGKCMYQYFNFKQQAQGNGSFNQSLEFAGAGENFYLSCENAQ